MGNIGDTITQTIPNVGASGTQYATDIDAFLTEVGVRLAAKVPRTSLASGALDLASQPLQNASYVSVAAAGGTPTTPASSIQQFGGDLYWVTGSGQVKITNGNALNTATIGGITGDYGGVNPAQFRFVDADQEYYAYDDFGGGAWARVWAKNYDIAAGATSAVRARLAYGGAGSYTMTLPAALPGSTLLMQMDSTGQITTSNTVAGQAPLFTSPIGLNLSGGLWLDSSAGHSRNGGNMWNILASAVPLSLFIPLSAPAIVTAYTVYLRKTTNGADALKTRLWSFDATNETTTAITAGTGTEANTANNPGFITLSATGLSTFVGVSTNLYIEFTPGGATAANHHLFGASISWKTA